MPKWILETERLLLREYTEGDFDALYPILSDPVTMQHYPRPYDERGVRRWISWSLENYERHGFGWWAILLKDSGELIGDAGITMQRIDGEILPELGYHIGCRHWRRGYGREACTAVLDWIFGKTDFDRLYSYMTKGNIASYSLAESLGMKRIKEYTDEDGEEMLVYEIQRGT
jgi:RimJ/RimL family protein N-acetyltransferase